MKERLDVLLVKRNLADSREKAKALIMSDLQTVCCKMALPRFILSM